MNISEPDVGLFGPGSESWRVLRERSVMMGGMRALLMQAAHPMIAAATDQTRLYQDSPWERHERTLRLTFTLVFGTRREAALAARQINAAHRSVRGLDPVSGLPYAARDPDLLLWVHATLVTSFLLFERLTMGSLDPAARQRFHEESALIARLVGLPSSHIPAEVTELEAYIEQTAGSGLLRRTDSSRLLVAFFRRRVPGIAGVKLRAAAFLAFHTLPPPLRELYGVDHRPIAQRQLEVLCGAIRLGRRAMPRRVRLIGPAIAADARMRGEPARMSDTPVLARR